MIPNRVLDNVLADVNSKACARCGFDVSPWVSFGTRERWDESRTFVGTRLWTFKSNDVVVSERNVVVTIIATVLDSPNSGLLTDVDVDIKSLI